jgi:selenocysteine-specific elongation factor
MAQKPPAAALAALLAAAPAGVDLDRFVLSRALTPAEGARAFADAGAQILKAKERRYGFGFARERVAELRAAVREALAAHHRQAPQSPGLERERLRLALAPRLPPAVFEAVIAALLEERAVALDGAWLRLPEHRAAFSPFEEKLWGRIRPRLDEAGFDPPRVRDLAHEFGVSEALLRQLMKRLARGGELVEVSPDRFYRGERVGAMAAILAEMAGPRGERTVAAAAFRDRIGTGRKLAILILEFFDRAGLTLRQGDLRKVRQDRIALFHGSG